jgi:hypothetical protein
LDFFQFVRPLFGTLAVVAGGVNVGLDGVVMQDTASLYEFARIGEVAETTTQLLALNMQHQTSLAARPRSTTRRVDPVEQYVLQQARDLLAQVREGFVLSVRTSQIPNLAELRFLLERVLLDWGALSQELGLPVEHHAQAKPNATVAADQGQTHQLERLRHQLLAFGMAATALGSLPHTPAAEVTFPYSFGKPPTYADIPAPATPAAMLQRIEELETMLWKLMATDLQELVNHAYGPLRRTYGFFEVSARLANQESKRFGIKRTGIA